ncbi:MAG: helix-turn-helix transcriptional regulator [Deltaproteobacteria bacterium]|nr:helix-turn-helix transcriptional regulator [Deltaproteobacteria bacterium]
MSAASATDIVLRDLSKRIRAARKALALTQEDAAHQAKIDYKRYQRIEAGEVNVTVKTIVRIAMALETTFGALAVPRRRRSPKLHDGVK